MPAEQFHALRDQWDRRYAEAPQLFRAEPDESLARFVAPLPPGTAVDLGAGEGRNSLWLARQGWDVTAVDASAVALGRLAEAAARSDLSVRTVGEDLVTFLAAARDAGDTFDLAVLAYIHPDADGRAELLSAAAASLKAGGHLFVVGHHLSSLGVAGPPHAERLYTEEDLRGVPGIDVLSLELRHGDSDVSAPGTDVVLWGRRDGSVGVTPAS
jgi:SAM-dependent methyltransferase